MKRLGLMAIALVLAGTGCSESFTGTEDAEIRVPDGSIPPDAGPPPMLCGNDRLDPGEMCDDGNRMGGDGCDANCRREAYCGDNNVDAGEVCDDGNNRSGDDCRSDCLSDETCGNGIVDFARGEVCDGTPTCAADCRSVTGCGDGTMAAGEQCDDGNIESFDGCDGACRNEIAMLIQTLAVADMGQGCDLNGDGRVDNAFVRALGLLSAVLNPLISQFIRDGQLTLLAAFLGLDDPLGTNDPDLRVAWLQGGAIDASSHYVDINSLNPDGSPLTSLQSQIMSNQLRGGPEDIPLPLPIPIDLRAGQIQGRTVPFMGQLEEIQDGLLCGGVPATLLALFGTFLGDMLRTEPPCDGSAEPATLLDLIIAGGTGTANFGGMSIPLMFRATRPDLDLDADGLETFEVRDSGPAGCQPVVTACIDGDGTRIDGRGCFSSPAIADGYSAAFNYTARRTTLAPAPTSPPPGP
jgi:cysteine-rich repeat protein